MNQTRWILAGIALIAWSAGWGLFFKAPIRIWWQERPFKLAKAKKEAQEKAVEHQQMLDELAANNPLPPGASSKPAGRA